MLPPNRLYLKKEKKNKIKRSASARYSSNTKLKRKAGVKVGFWERELAKVTCSGG